MCVEKDTSIGPVGSSSVYEANGASICQTLADIMYVINY